MIQRSPLAQWLIRLSRRVSEGSKSSDIRAVGQPSSSGPTSGGGGTMIQRSPLAQWLIRLSRRVSEGSKPSDIRAVGQPSSSGPTSGGGGTIHSPSPMLSLTQRVRRMLVKIACQPIPWSASMTPGKARCWIQLASLCVLIAAIATVLARIELERARQEQLDKLRQQLDGIVDGARNDVQAVVIARAEVLAEFVLRGKKGTRKFSEEVTGYYGKWRAAKPFLPFVRENDHGDFIEEQFGKHVISKESLGRAIESAVRDCIRSIEEVENTLAVNMRQVVGGDPEKSQVPVEVTERFRMVLEEMRIAVQEDAGKGVGRIVAAETVAYIGTEIFIRLGVTVGVFAAGAANTWWSLGASLVISLIVDALWDWFDDPLGDVQRAADDALDRLSKDLVQAFVDQMRGIANQRAARWEQIADTTINERTGDK
jgi:hypothetical protein